jgi:hypothetical protein
MKSVLRCAFVLAAVCALPIAARASVITWSAPVAITTDGSASDVLNTGGAVIQAEYAQGSGTQTVNGIAFTDGFTDYNMPQGTTI